ncbi:MAG: DUF3172 domain-containing protein [Pseudanabaenaceae cyanobacterium]
MVRRTRSPAVNTPNNAGVGLKIAILGAVFAIGLGVGAALSTLNPTPQTVDAIRLDNIAPSREFCNNYGSSAMVMITRTYITLNPYAVYTSQTESVPGCVVLPQNWNLLLSKNAITNDDIQQCRNRMNTFGFIGDLDNKPRVDCVYETRDAQRQLTQANQ